MDSERSGTAEDEGISQKYFSTQVSAQKRGANLGHPAAIKRCDCEAVALTDRRLLLGTRGHRIGACEDRESRDWWLRTGNGDRPRGWIFVQLDHVVDAQGPCAELAAPTGGRRPAVGLVWPRVLCLESAVDNICRPSWVLVIRSVVAYDPLRIGPVNPRIKQRPGCPIFARSLREGGIPRTGIR